MKKFLSSRIESLSSFLLSRENPKFISAALSAVYTADNTGKFLADKTDIFSTMILGGLASVTVGSLTMAGIAKVFNKSSFKGSLDDALTEPMPLMLSSYGLIAASVHPQYSAVIQHLKNMF